MNEGSTCGLLMEACCAWPGDRLDDQLVFRRRSRSGSASASGVVAGRSADPIVWVLAREAGTSSNDNGARSCFPASSSTRLSACSERGELGPSASRVVERWTYVWADSVHSRQRVTRAHRKETEL
jgi:hypothetical protein